VDAAKRSLGEAARRAREGYHVSGFPEGSRRRAASTGTRDQNQPLKKGFFHLVNDLLSHQDTIVEIYPVVYVGSLRSWPKGHAVPVRDAKVLIRIGDPVVIEKPCDVDAIKDQMSDKLGVELETAWSTSSESTKLNMWSIFGFETICSVIPTIGFIYSLFR
jgi:1-acyl-sn-glycerol-3-phosphate acyltransferase